MNEAFERMYRWYVLGCRLDEQIPMSREEFAERQLLQLLNGGLLASEVFDRTSAEWALASEDAAWTTILQRLSRLNIAAEESDLVAAVLRGRDADEDGDVGNAGVPARLPPFHPVLIGAAKVPIPQVERELSLCGR